MFQGLSYEEVEAQKKKGLINYDDGPRTKTVKEIIRDNFFTYFNFINIALGGSILIVGIVSGNFFTSLKNCLFMGVILINSIISIVEEIISKKIIDKLSLLSKSSVTVIREGKQEEVDAKDIVLGDTIEYTLGDQIVTDAVLLTESVEVNESYITGEADAIEKKKGDTILSGSFLVSGKAVVRVSAVGKDNYISKISREAKDMKKANSMIMDSFEKILKVISFLIIPVGVVMYFSQLKATNYDITTSIFTTVAALIGMIPEGLVLLTSSVMAVSIIRLSKYKVLVQELYCIETLARVNCICLDKTGTLTEGKMKVVKEVPFSLKTQKDLKEAMEMIVSVSEDENATMLALKSYYSSNEKYKAKNIFPFSSSRKFAGIEVDSSIIYYGAPEYLLKDKYKMVENTVKKFAENYRVLVICKGKVFSKSPKDLEILGYVLIEDVIRKEAKDTIAYFKNQSVEVKIISGDNIDTVMNIAKRAGLTEISGVDASHVTKENAKDLALNYNVFGRVTPNGKKLLVESLQKAGYTVAMTGDGVNDCLALKQSDCAIALASGSESARVVSQIVLLDSNFDSLPKVVAEGRRTINNIERSASLLLVKTIYTMFLILFSIGISSKYFFVPIQLTLITGFTIGIPSFILALEPNHELVSGNFLLKVIGKSVPAALTVVFNIVIVTLFRNAFGLDELLCSALFVLLTGTTGFLFLYRICKPFNFLRTCLYIFLLLGFSYCVLYQYDFFNISTINFDMVLIYFVMFICSMYIFDKLNLLVSWIYKKVENRQEQKEMA